MVEHLKKEEDRKKAIAGLKLSHANVPTPEQKTYREHIKETRANFHYSDEEESSSSCENSNKEREPNLNNCTSKYDLKLFQEAQAVASEAIVSTVYY